MGFDNGSISSGLLFGRASSSGNVPVPVLAAFQKIKMLFSRLKPGLRAFLRKNHTNKRQ